MIQPSSILLFEIASSEWEATKWGTPLPLTTSWLLIYIFNKTMRNRLLRLEPVVLFFLVSHVPVILRGKANFFLNNTLKDQAFKPHFIANFCLRLIIERRSLLYQSFLVWCTGCGILLIYLFEGRWKMKAERNACLKKPAQVYVLLVVLINKYFSSYNALVYFSSKLHWYKAKRLNGQFLLR